MGGLLAGALLVAVVALADVLIHSAEIGRRRGLGAPRWALTWILISRSLVGALAGTAVGTATATVVVLRSGQHPDIAFTLATAEGQPLEQAMRFASATAALKCTRFGGAFGSPQRAEVEDFLAANAPVTAS